jgi:hypothetical protein
MATIVQYVLDMKDSASPALRGTASAAGEATKGTKGLTAASAGTRAGMLALGSALVSAGPALVAFVQSSVDARNAIIDMSTRTTIATDTLQGLILAFRGSGQQASEAQRVLNKWPAILAQVQTGTGRQAEALNRLGVSAVDASGNLRSGDAVFRDFLDRLSGVENQTQRAAIAADVFGAAGTKLLQALGDPASLDQFVTLAGRFGTDVGPEAAEAAAKWQRAIANLELSIDHVKDAILTGLGGSTMAQLVNHLSVGIQAATIVFMEWGRGVVLFADLIASQIQNVFDGDFTIKGAEAALDRFKEEDAAATAAMIADIKALVTASRSLFEGAPGPRPGPGGTGGGGAPKAAEAAAGVAFDLKAGIAAVAAAAPPFVDGLDRAWEAADNFRASLAAATAESAAMAAATRAERAAKASGALDAVAGGVGGLTGALSAAGPAGQIAASIVGVIDGIGKGLLDDINGLLSGLAETLSNLGPILSDFAIELVTEVVPALIEAVPALVSGILTEAIPAMASVLLDPAFWLDLWWTLVESLLVELPRAIFVGVRDWFRDAWAAIRDWFRDLFTPGKDKPEGEDWGALIDEVSRDVVNASAGSRHSGGRLGGGARLINQTGRAVLDRGEIVSPASGSMTQGARAGLRNAGAGGGGAGVVVNLSAAVVDPNTIPALARLLEQTLGPFGRAPAPRFT